MKGHIFLIIAGIVVTSLAAYEVCKSFCKTTSKDCKKDSTYNDCIQNAPNVSKTEEIYTKAATDGYKTKEVAIRSMRKRHIAAAKAMEESLNIIFNDSKNNDIVTENSPILGETRNDLDDILK